MLSPFVTSYDCWYPLACRHDMWQGGAARLPLRVSNSMLTRQDSNPRTRHLSLTFATFETMYHGLVWVNSPGRTSFLCHGGTWAQPDIPSRNQADHCTHLTVHTVQKCTWARYLYTTESVQSILWCILLGVTGFQQQQKSKIIWS